MAMAVRYPLEPTILGRALTMADAAFSTVFGLYG